MTAEHKRVVRFNVWINPIFDATLAANGGMQVTACRLEAPEQESLDVLRQAQVYHVSPAKDELPKKWFVSADLLANCPELLVVSSAGAGYDTVDVDACTKAGIVVVNQAGANAISVAEHTLAMMLSLSHRIAEADRTLRASARGFTREDLMGRDLNGKVLGLVGIGHVGSKVAQLARAFGMQVLATDPNVAPEEISRRGATPVSFEQLLAQSDVVSLHCPRLSSTVKLMDAAAFGRMKAGATFITTARGGIHDEQALLDALRSGHLGGAGLDVWDTEPPPPGFPLLQLPNVVGTHHTAGVTHEARYNIALIAAQQIIHTLGGGVPPRLINPEVWPLYAKRYEAAFGKPPAALPG